MSHEIRADGFENNMAGWTSEKAGNVVESIAAVLDELAVMSPAPLKSTVKIRRRLREMLWDATKLWSFGIGAEWTIHDADMVLKGGTRGFKKLEKQYRRSAP